MDVESRLAVVRDTVHTEMLRADKRRRIDKRKGLVLRLASVVLAATITVLLGLDGLGSDASTTLKNLALVCGATITIANAWDAFFNHQGLWVMYTDSLVELAVLRDDIDYYVAGRDPAEYVVADVDEFHERLTSIRTTTQDRWRSLYRASGPVPEPDER